MPVIVYKTEDGKRVPSVTTVLSQWGIKTRPLMYWAYKRGEQGIPLHESEEADVGTLAHMRIEAEIKNKEIDLTTYDDNLIKQSDVCIENWETWKQSHNFQPVESEISLVSEEHRFGGTIDIMALINGKLSIADIKTGKEVYEDHIIQIVAYSKLWEENFPQHPIDGGYHIIRLGKEIPMFSYNYYGRFPEAWEVFLHLKELHELHKEIKKLK